MAFRNGFFWTEALDAPRRPGLQDGRASEGVICMDRLGCFPSNPLIKDPYQNRSKPSIVILLLAFWEPPKIKSNGYVFFLDPSSLTKMRSSVTWMENPWKILLGGWSADLFPQKKVTSRIARFLFRGLDLTAWVYIYIYK